MPHNERVKRYGIQGQGQTASIELRRSVSVTYTILINESEMINSDELGEKGESRFKELCADASLTCNKSDRDRTGWDFIVEFPFDDDPSVPLDHRKTPISCHIQHKTILTTSKSVSMRLNMAERLAKELKPSFICVFKVDKTNNEFTDAFLIHISKKRLGAILKRLRTEEAKSEGKPINQMDISFTPTESERIDISGTSLRDALKKFCGPDLHHYATEKQTQLQRLGFEIRPINVTATFEMLDKEQLLDVFLGLAKEVPVSLFETSETRFGITLPGHRSTQSKLTFQPSPSDTCTIIVRGDELDSPSVFKGDVFFPPKALGPLSRFLIRSDLFSIQIGLTEIGTRPTFSFDIQGKSCTPTIWADYWRMLSAFQKNTGVVEIRAEKFSQSIEIPIAVDDLINMGNWPTPETCIIMCEGLSKILKQAGIQPEPSFEFVKIIDVSNRIMILLNFMNGTLPPLELSASQGKGDSQIPLGKFILASQIQVGTIVIAYYATTLVEFQISDEHNTAHFREFKLMKVRCIDGESATYEKFIAQAKVAEKIEHVRYF